MVKHRKSHHYESNDLVEKQHRNKRPIDPETRLACLQKKQNKLRERLASLQAAENPKAQSQATKVQQKLAAITSEIDSFPASPVIPPVSSQTVVAETFVVVPETSVVPALTAELAVKPVDPPARLDDKEVKQVFNKFFSLRRDLVSDKRKIHQLSKVIHALRILSRLGEKAPIKVDDDQLTLAKTSLEVARTAFRAKKMEVKQQKQQVKKLQKQGYMPDRKLEKEKKDKKDKQCKKDKKEKKCKKEKSWKGIEDNVSKQEAKAQWCAEKAKRKEEKAAMKALKWQEKGQPKTSPVADIPSVDAPQF